MNKHSGKDTQRENELKPDDRVLSPFNYKTSSIMDIVAWDYKLKTKKIFSLVGNKNQKKNDRKKKKMLKRHGIFVRTENENINTNIKKRDRDRKRMIANCCSFSW